MLFIDIVDFRAAYLRNWSVEDATKIDHPYYLTQDTMQAYLRRAGFAIAHADYAADHLHVSYVCRPAAPEPEALPAPASVDALLREVRLVQNTRRRLRRLMAAADAVLAIVPARGGSKGVPGKNLRPLAGRLAARVRGRGGARSRAWSTATILSTDSTEIADAGRRIGLEVPFLRPAELAQDDTPMLPVIQHALGELAARGLDAGDRRAAAADVAAATPRAHAPGRGAAARRAARTRWSRSSRCRGTCRPTT